MKDWIKCEERLPTNEDADCEGNVWIFTTTHKEVASLPPSVVVDFADKISHWMPTSLTRPEPPAGE